MVCILNLTLKKENLCNLVLYCGSLLNCIWQLVLVLEQLTSHLIKMGGTMICVLSLKLMGMMKKAVKMTNYFSTTEAFQFKSSLVFIFLRSLKCSENKHLI